MTFASGDFGQLRYIPEATPNVTPVTGNGINLRCTNQTFKAKTSVVKSKELRADRLSTGQTITDVNVDGGFPFELSGKEYDPFIEALLCSTYVHHGTSGLGTAFVLTTAAGSVTAAVAPTGSSAFTTLAAGSWFKIVPPVGATAAVKAYFADKWLKVGSTTTTVITLDASTQISGAGLGITAAAGYAISQSVVANGALTPKTFTFEYAMADINQFLPYRGQQVNSLNLDLQIGAIVTGDFGFIGRGHNGMVGATTLPGSPVASQTLEVMNSAADLGALYEGNTNLLSVGSFVKSAKLSVTNNLRAQKALGVMGSAGVGLGELVITGTLELYVEDAEHYNKWYTGLNTSLVIGVADAAGNGYLVELNKIAFTDGALNPGGKGADAMLSLPFEAFYDPTTGKGIRITRAIAA